MESLKVRNFIGALFANVKNMQFGALLKIFRRRLYSDWRFYGLCRDLRTPFQPPAAKIPVAVRTLRHDDIPQLLSYDTPGTTGRGPYERMFRMNFINARIGTCYVAETAEGIPCYMQWLICAKENEGIQEYFGGLFPVLAGDEALLEFAFTPETFQGKGIMAHAMAVIAEKAASSGATRVVTFVDHQNIPALKGCMRAGFSPYLLRTDRWRWFRRRVEFSPLPAGTGYPFER